MCSARNSLAAIDGGGQAPIITDASGQAQTDGVGEEVGVESAGPGFADHEAHVRVSLGEAFGHLGGGDGRSHPGRGDEEDMMAAPGPLGRGMAGKVDDDEVEGLTGRGEEVVEDVRVEVDGVVPTPGQQSESVVAGQRIGQGGGAQLSAGGAEVGPAGSGDLLGSEDEVEAAAERIGVDEHGAVIGTGPSGERTGEDGGSGTAASDRKSVV